MKEHPLTASTPPAQPRISLIIPVAPGDESWRALIQDLGAMERRGRLAATGIDEILLSSDDEQLGTQLALSLQHQRHSFAELIQVLPGGAGRAASMNRAAASASGDYLWFVHADSRLLARHLQALQASLQQAPDALHYFNLRFDGHALMQLNAWGVWFRSHVLKTPFGDQAFCLSRSGFQALGGYPEQAGMGEDHLLVWHALQQDVPLQCTGATLETSARKYQQYGWLRTTSVHVYLWARQAWPEFRQLVRQRRARRRQDNDNRERQT
ncbi:MAG: hypothetical protein R3E95_23305 [Thiolinea sp.]